MNDYDIKEAFAEGFEGDSAQEREKLVAQEKAMYRISDAIYQAMQEAGLNKIQLAELVDKKPAFITRLFKGDNNMTIKTLAAFAFALDKEIKIELQDRHNKGLEWQEINNNNNILPFIKNASKKHTVHVNDFQTA